MTELHPCTLLAGYLSGGFIMLAWMAVIDTHEIREAFWVALLWPLVLAVLLPMLLSAMLWKYTGWSIQLVRRPADLSPWGMRRPPAQRNLRGIGIRCPLFELQFLKPKAVKP